jgi:hypothetical protein
MIRVIRDKTTDNTDLFADLYGSSASHKIDDQNHHRNDKQQVNQTSTHVRQQSNQPQDQQNYQNCPQHDRISFFKLSTARTSATVMPRRNCAFWNKQFGEGCITIIRFSKPGSSYVLN